MSPMALKRILDFSGITSNYISENSSFSFLKLLRGGLAGNEVEMMFFPQIISLFSEMVDVKWEGTHFGAIHSWVVLANWDCIYGGSPSSYLLRNSCLS